MKQAVDLYLNSDLSILDCAKIFSFDRKKLSKFINDLYPNAKLIKFKNLCSKKHNNKFDYSLVDFSNYRQKVKIICPKHGVFEQEVYSHTKGYDCKRCSAETASVLKTHSKEKFIQLSKKKHGNYYDYSKSDLIKDYIPIIITCKIHGDFKQIPYDHKNGKGCPVCASENKGWNLSKWIKASKGRRGILYVIKCKKESEEFIKIGRTFNSVKRRYSSKKIPYTYEIIKEFSHEDLKKVWEIERNLKRILKNDRIEPNYKFEGWTECFSLNSLDKIINYAETH